MTAPEVFALLKRIQAGNLAVLVGELETHVLEFKSQPYVLEADVHKQELAKDVSALANGEGGCIILGVKTKKSEIHPTDEAAAIRSFAKSLVNPEQYQDIIREWIYPPPEGVEVRWCPDSSEKDHGLIAIIVPLQDMSRRPFLVRRTVVGDRRDGVTFGMYQRRHANADPLSVQEVQSLMRDGFILKQVLDLRPSEGLPVASRAFTLGTASEPAFQILQRRTKETTDRAESLVEALTLNEAPAYVLAATPFPAMDAAGMFESKSHPIVVALRTPPEIRNSGFDMDIGDEPHIQNGQSRRSLSRGYKGLEFWFDGTLVFAASGSRFLAWGDRSHGALGINSVVLAESVYLFCYLFETLMDACRATPDQIVYSVQLRRMCVNNNPPLLWPGEPTRLRFPSDATQAPGCECQREVTLPGTLPLEVAAYRVLGSVYSWFGLEHDAIPFVRRDDTPPALNPEAIAALT